MAVYTFSFPASAAGLAVTVRDADGATVDTGTVGAASGVQGYSEFSAALPAGDYVATAADIKQHYSATATGVFDVDSALLRLVSLSYGALSAAVAIDGEATLTASGLPVGDYILDWGDGSVETVDESEVSGDSIIMEPGDYTITLTGPVGYYASIAVTVLDGEVSGPFTATF